MAFRLSTGSMVRTRTQIAIAALLVAPWIACADTLTEDGFLMVNFTGFGITYPMVGFSVNDTVVSPGVVEYSPWDGVTGPERWEGTSFNYVLLPPGAVFNSGSVTFTNTQSSLSWDVGWGVEEYSSTLGTAQVGASCDSEFGNSPVSSQPAGGPLAVSIPLSTCAGPVVLSLTAGGLANFVLDADLAGLAAGFYEDSHYWGPPIIDYTITVDYSPDPPAVPEPSYCAAIGLLIAGMLIVRRRPALIHWKTSGNSES